MLYNLPVSIVLPEELREKLIAEAKWRGVNSETLIEELLSEQLAIKQRFHDLDHLAGTWSEVEEKNF
jgi:hypothetical protein